MGEVSERRSMVVLEGRGATSSGQGGVLTESKKSRLYKSNAVQIEC